MRDADAVSKAGGRASVCARREGDRDTCSLLPVPLFPARFSGAWRPDSGTLWRAAPPGAGPTKRTVLALYTSLLGLSLESTRNSARRSCHL